MIDRVPGGDPVGEPAGAMEDPRRGRALAAPDRVRLEAVRYIGGECHAYVHFVCLSRAREC